MLERKSYPTSSNSAVCAATRRLSRAFRRVYHELAEGIHGLPATHLPDALVGSQVAETLREMHK